MQNCITNLQRNTRRLFIFKQLQIRRWLLVRKDFSFKVLLFLVQVQLSVSVAQTILYPLCFTSSLRKLLPEDKLDERRICCKINKI